MTNNTAAQNIATETFTCDSRTGATATRYRASFACKCPACGDNGPHPGKGESARASQPNAGDYTIWCNWCGESFAGPPVA